MNEIHSQQAEQPVSDPAAHLYAAGGPPRRGRPVVLSTADDQFALPLAVMLRSLADNLTWTPQVDVYVLDCGISRWNKWNIRRSLPAGALRVCFLPVPMGRLGDVNLGGYWSRSVYAKLLMGELLPADVRRAIFIDADTLVLRDVGELWELDLDGHPLGAVLDPEYRLQEAFLWGGDPGFWGVTPETPYFNSGLMVIDLDRWRREGIGMQSLRLLQMHPERMRCVDQGALNVFIKGNFKTIDDAWNVSWLFYDLPAGTFAGEDGERRKQTYRNPRMIHFWGPNKPWLRPGPAYGTERFFAYLHRTAWWNSVPFAPWKNDPLRKRFRRWLRVWKARILGWRM